jgi:hypothetical protein
MQIVLSSAGCKIGAQPRSRRGSRSGDSMVLVRFPATLVAEPFATNLGHKLGVDAWLLVGPVEIWDRG